MSNENTERIDRAGWYEFIMPGGSTTHIAYAYENGTVYLPEGEDVVSEQDFHLASASDRFWRLVREPKQVTTVAELDGIAKVMTRHLLERGSLIDAWPEDEREAYRTAKDYDEREDAVLELRIGKILSELAPLLAAAKAEAWEQGQKSGARHADRMIAAHSIGRLDLPGPISPNPYRTT